MWAGQGLPCPRRRRRGSKELHSGRPGGRPTPRSRVCSHSFCLSRRKPGCCSQTIDRIACFRGLVRVRGATNDACNTLCRATSSFPAATRAAQRTVFLRHARSSQTTCRSRLRRASRRSKRTKSFSSNKKLYVCTSATCSRTRRWIM
jgi:hypothetical protein